MSMMKKSIASIQRKVVVWMRQGISPQRLALTLSLGFAIGCIPVVGIPTLVCSALAVALQLNLPVIQAANYAAMPLQLLLIVPFVHLGERLVSYGTGHTIEAGALLHAAPLDMISRMGGLAGQALLAWLLIAVPAVALMTAALTVLLRRVPALAAAEAGN
jgi:uncharacterized protein (DUF2062 family)